MDTLFRIDLYLNQVKNLRLKTLKLSQTNSKLVFA